MLEADLRRRGERVHSLAGRDAQLRAPQIADELENSLVQLGSGGERDLPLLPQTPPPGRAVHLHEAAVHSARPLRAGERDLPLLPQTPPPGRAVFGFHREKVTRDYLKTSTPFSRVMGQRLPSSRRRRPWKEPGAR